MTLTAFATKDIEAETLAAAVLVMEAYRGQGNQFPGDFSKHPAIRSAPKGEGFSFTADMGGLMSPVSFSLNRPGAQEQAVSLSTGQPLDTQIEKALSRKGGPAKPGKEPTPGV